MPPRTTMLDAASSLLILPLYFSPPGMPLTLNLSYLFSPKNIKDDSACTLNCFIIFVEVVGTKVSILCICVK